ncbi:MAG: response regulator [Pseudomonadota bacterium]
MASCLIVDDSDVIREISVRIVRALGLDPIEATNAPDGVEACADKKPGVVLLDWDLPSLGALDFLRGVAAMDEKDRPAIVLCATENDPQQFTLAKAAGAEYHVLKPFDEEVVAAVFAEIGLPVEAPASAGDKKNDAAAS